MASVLQWLVSTILVSFAAAAPQLVDQFSTFNNDNNNPLFSIDSNNPNFNTFRTRNNPNFRTFSTVNPQLSSFGTFSTDNPRYSTFGTLSPDNSRFGNFGTFGTDNLRPGTFGSFRTDNPHLNNFRTFSTSNPPLSTFSTSNPPLSAFTTDNPRLGPFSTVDRRLGTFSTDNPRFDNFRTLSSANPSISTLGFTDSFPTETTFPFELSTLSPTFSPTEIGDFDQEDYYRTTRNSTLRRRACRIHFISDDEVQWSSPNFGRGEYPSKARCKLSLSSKAPGYATFEFSSQGYDIKSGDFIHFNQPIRMAKLGKVWDGYAPPNTIIRGDLPTFNFDAEFRSDSSFNGAGFNVTISRQTTNCHQIVNGDGIQTTGILEAPREANYGSGFQTKRSCEWWIRAPEGKYIQLQIMNVRVTSSVYNNFDDNGVVIVDKLGDKYYPELTSLDFVGTTLPAPVKSIGNRMNVLFYSGTLTDAFQARWSVVDE